VVLVAVVGLPLALAELVLLIKDMVEALEAETVAVAVEVLLL
jgi:hypothetical protein